MKAEEDARKAKEEAENVIDDFKNYHPTIRKKLLAERAAKEKEERRKIKEKERREKEARDAIEAAKQEKILSVHPILREQVEAEIKEKEREARLKEIERARRKFIKERRSRSQSQSTLERFTKP